MAIAVALGTTGCGERAPTGYDDPSTETRAARRTEPVDTAPPQSVAPSGVEREIPLDRLLEIPEGATADTSLDPPLDRPSGVGPPESDPILPEWLDLGIDIDSERTQAPDPGHDVHSRKVGVSVGWTGDREEEGERGPTVAIEAEVREDTSESNPDEPTRNESIGLRVIVPFRAKGATYPR